MAFRSIESLVEIVMHRAEDLLPRVAPYDEAFLNEAEPQGSLAFLWYCGERVVVRCKAHEKLTVDQL